MEKEKEISLEEVQTLSRQFKYCSHGKRKFTDEYKRRVVQKIIKNQLSVIAYSEKIGIHKQTIYNWINNFAKGKSSSVAEK